MKVSGKGVLLLCGISGSGKTETGQILAEAMGIPFKDLDHVVARKAGRSIAEIFSMDGENAFRELEVEILMTILDDGKPAIIALGGGTLESESVRKIIRQNSVTLIWLKASPSEAARRLEAGNLVDERPLLKGLRGESLNRKLGNLLDMRRAHYSMCEFAVDSDGLTPGQVTSRIEDLLPKSQAPHSPRDEA